MLTLHCRTAVNLELVGYDGLAETPLFKGSIGAGEKQEIATPYQGFVLLRFSGGQGYPVLLGDASFALNIAGPAEPPAFTGSEENDSFSSRLAGKGPDAVLSDFALLLLQAKQLLESSQSTRTVKELTAKEKEFLEFVRENYDKLKHSDMVRRLIAQYLMMQEYVDYHVEGAPATDIRVKYQQAVLDGVGSWIEILKPHIPEHEVLNYIVSLYYDRSMVALASLITTRYEQYAYCPGAEKNKWTFPEGLTVSDSSRSIEKSLAEIKGKKTIAFVSDECPVSMIQAVMLARQIAEQGKGEKLIVAPLEQLSERHLAMNKMVNGGNMLFVNDEKWRTESLANKIRLPLFLPLGDDLSLPVRTSIK